MSLANAILAGDQSLVAHLLAQGEDCNAMDEYGYKPLIEAAIANNTEMTKLLLEHGAKINEQDVTGGTALHWAAENNNLALAKLLLDAGADPNAYTAAAQPVLIKPLLRGHTALKRLLIDNGADLNFAQDYINAKLLGHRFELSGRVDIVDANGKFIEVDFEGFILEFTVSLQRQSLQYYLNNFAARNLRAEFSLLKQIAQAFVTAEELVRYQQYLLDINHYQQRINVLLQQELLLLPVGYEGHAITLIKYKNFLVRCDRGEIGRKEQSIMIYRIQNPTQLNLELLKYILYQKHTGEFINYQLKRILELEYFTNLPIESQVAGNCSWANMEAAIPSMYFILRLLADKRWDKAMIVQAKEAALNIYKNWLEWDKDWALDQSVQSFHSASPARKASIAAILAAILFQTCNYENTADQKRANKIFSILSQPQYRYVLDSYVQIYSEDRSQMGKNLQQLLDLYLR